MKSVCADVTDSAGGAGLLRVGTPRGLLLSCGFERRRQPILRVLELNHAQLAELARRDHFLRLPDERIPAVVICNRQHAPCTFADADQLGRIGHRSGQRLVADDVAARFEEFLRGGVCRWFGVTIATTSTRSARAPSARTISSTDP